MLKSLDINPEYVDKRVFESEDGQRFNQEGYHGSPKNFDVFDLNYNLKGEGFNAHGYGIYIAKKKPLAENYRKKLADHTSYQTFKVNDIKYTSKDTAIFKGLSLYKYYGKKTALKVLNEVLNDKQYHIYYGNEEKIIQAISLIKSIKKQSEIKETFGQTYKVEIPENDVLLDENKLLSKQPLKVRQAIVKYMKDNPQLYITADLTENNLSDGLNGREFYNELTKEMMRQKT